MWAMPYHNPTTLQEISQFSSSSNFCKNSEDFTFLEKESNGVFNLNIEENYDS